MLYMNSTSISFKDFIRYFKNSKSYKSLYNGYEVLREMFTENCYRFISFTEHLVIEDLPYYTLLKLVDHNLVNAFMTYSRVLDIELCRIFDIDFEDYDKLYDTLREVMLSFVKDISNTCLRSPSDLLKCFFKFLGRLINKKSLFINASSKDVEIFIPDVVHTLFAKVLLDIDESFNNALDILNDERKICDIMFEYDKIGAVFLYGSLPKHHVQWWSAVRDGLDYAIQITPIFEYDGSLSGARIEESITWNQLRPNGRGVSIVGDPVIIFPILVNAVLEDLNI